MNKETLKKQVFITGDSPASLLNQIAEDIKYKFPDYDIVIVLSPNLRIIYDVQLDFKYEMV